MFVSITNCKTQKSSRSPIYKGTIEHLKETVLGAALSPDKFNTVVCAESQEDIDFICTHFTNIPLPDSKNDRAFWIGEIAMFIILNFPETDEDTKEI